MIIVACLSCKLAIRVIGDPNTIDSLVGVDSEFWPQAYICPECGSGCRGVRETEVEPAAFSLMKVQELTAQEAFIAFHGMGLPEHRECTGTEVHSLFKLPVRRVVGENSKTGRFVIDHIEFNDGTKLYLGSSPAGAVVYKISPPPGYAERV